MKIFISNINKFCDHHYANKKATTLGGCIDSQIVDPDENNKCCDPDDNTPTMCKADTQNDLFKYLEVDRDDQLWNFDYTTKILKNKQLDIEKKKWKYQNYLWKVEDLQKSGFISVNDDFQLWKADDSNPNKLVNEHQNTGYFF